MDVRGYLDLCGETPIPTGEGGGRVGRRGGADAIDNRKISFILFFYLFLFTFLISIHRYTKSKDVEMVLVVVPAIY